MSIHRTRPTRTRGVITLAMTLAGCLLVPDIRAQATAEEDTATQTAAEAAAEAQARALAARLKQAFGGKELPQLQAPPSGTSRYAQRRAFHEARRQAKQEREEVEGATRVAAARQTSSLGEPASRPVTPSSSSTKPLPAGTAPGDITVAFKLPAGTQGWSSAPIFTAPPQVGGLVTVEAKVQARDAKGQPIDIRPEWKPADPTAVEIAPAEGGVMKITVRGRGESNLTLVGPGYSKELWISATHEGNVMRVQISQ